ncbi:MAG: hypothetical protein B6242_15615 [Anaerolineaceae bacterium 4572_78]|nr:MAG: hypothetical protein B6242_15615 [Anaerolineaceae bacterium 4572_78]
MKHKPIIGVPCRHDISGHYENSPINAQSSPYIVAVLQADGIPFLIPLDLNDDDLRQLYEMADGILLAGGEDIDPKFYNQSRHPKLGRTQPKRDKAEISLCQWAIKDKKPLLGICRGIQLMTVAGGGTLWQDIDSQLDTTEKHANFTSLGYAYNHLAHEVTLMPDSSLAKALQTDKFMVNSLHHQAIQNLPESYRAIGWATDKIVEAIDLADHPLFWGVQWHPEMLVAENEIARRIFKTFVEFCQQ